MSFMCIYSHIQENIVSEGCPYLIFNVEEITFKHTKITCNGKVENSQLLV